MHVASSQERLLSARSKLTDMMGTSMKSYVNLDSRLTRLEGSVQEIADKLNGLIGVIDGVIREKKIKSPRVRKKV